MGNSGWQARQASDPSFSLETGHRVCGQLRSSRSIEQIVNAARGPSNSPRYTNAHTVSFLVARPGVSFATTYFASRKTIMASPPINASPEDPSGTWGLLDLIQGSQSLENIDTIVLSSAMSTLVRLCKSVPLWLTVGALIASIQLLICSVLIAKQNKKVSRRHSLFSSGGLVLLSL